MVTRINGRGQNRRNGDDHKRGILIILFAADTKEFLKAVLLLPHPVAPHRWIDLNPKEYGDVSELDAEVVRIARDHEMAGVDVALCHVDKLYGKDI